MCKITDDLKKDFVELGSTISELFKENGDLKKYKEFTAVTIEGTDDIIYVSDIKTNKILFLNSSGKELFGENSIGKDCYEVFQNADNPCQFCTNDIIAQQVGVPYRWIHYNEKLQKMFLITNIAKEIEGKVLRFERATEITNQIKDIIDKTEKYNLI